MVNERRSERSSLLLARTARKETGFAPKPSKSFDHLELKPKQAESAEMQPTAKITSKTSTPATQISRRMAEDTEKKNSRQLPPIPVKTSYTPRKARVSFLPPSQQSVQRRRLSIPEESLNRLPKPILKKRHSVSIDYKEPASQQDQVDTSILWSLPWERELYLPPIAPNGMLVFLDEDGSLPPMLRRLSNPDTYNYSQEFLKALDDLKNRPSS